jgi:hypothetical protein
MVMCSARPATEHSSENGGSGRELSSLAMADTSSEGEREAERESKQDGRGLARGAKGDGEADTTAWATATRQAQHARAAPWPIWSQ